MFVLTADQRGSRRDLDRVEGARALLADLAWLRAPDRTAGDELQAVTDDPAVATTAALLLLADGHWSTGIGVGPVEEPLPRQTRAGRGRAFEAARDAVTAAKHAAVPVQVRGAAEDACRRAEANLSVLGFILVRRTPQGREVVELMDSGLTQAAAAARLEISPQAVSQRLAAAGWSVERGAREATAYLLAEADTAATGAAR